MRSTLKRRRIKLGIGLRELARRLNVSPSALCQWEGGTKRPTKEHAQDWRTALRERKAR